MELKNKCVIVEVEPSVFRLVHPVHVEWYRTQVMASGCTIGIVQEFRPTGRRGMLAEGAIIDGIAKQRNLSVLHVALGDLCSGLQRLQKAEASAVDTQFEGSHLFTFSSEKGTGTMLG
jgi:hypothetical protein